MTISKAVVLALLRERGQHGGLPAAAHLDPAELPGSEPA